MLSFGTDLTDTQHVQMLHISDTMINYSVLFNNDAFLKDPLYFPFHCLNRRDVFLSAFSVEMRMTFEYQELKEGKKV